MLRNLKKSLTNCKILIFVGCFRIVIFFWSVYFLFFVVVVVSPFVRYVMDILTQSDVFVKYKFELFLETCRTLADARGMLGLLGI